MGHRAHNADPRRLVPVHGGDQGGGHHHGQHGRQLGCDIRQARTGTQANQPWGQGLARQHQKQHAARTNTQCDEVGARRGVDQLNHGIQDIGAARLHAQQVLDLPHSNEHSRARDKTADHRMAQKMGQKTQPQHPKQQQHAPGQQRQQHGQRHVVGRASGGQGLQGAGRHERSDCHRAHGQRHAGPQRGIGNDRQDAGVQAHFGRQARQQRVGQALRDQHHRHDHAGNHVAGEPGLLVVTDPAGNDVHEGSRVIRTLQRPSSAPAQTIGQT